MAQTIGIIGGMGPEATVDLMAKIIWHTPARKDQDHLHIIVDNNPQVPDRTQAILYGGEDPTPFLLASAKLLEKAGANLLVIACNTAHYFLPRIINELNVPIIDMMEATSEYIASEFNLTRVGLLASTGTVKSGLYQLALSKYNLSCFIPDERNQEIVMDVIYSVKAKRKDVKSSIALVVNYLVECWGCQAIIAGCTEIPLVLSQDDTPVPIIDPTDVLAQKAVHIALGS